MMPPKFRNRAERRAWLDANVTDFRWNPAGYEPEPWDVVKDGAVTVVRGVNLATAEDACFFLNTNNRPHEYELVPARTGSGAAK